MKTRALSIPLIAAGVAFVALAAFAVPKGKPEPKAGAIRVLFLGHESEHHNSNKFYPMLAKGLGRDAIYFDYVTSVEEALGDAAYLSKFDAVLLYANHGEITPVQWKNLKGYVEGGGGFVPVHCASWCFGNEPGFDQLVGGRFASHKTGTFTAKVVDAKHPAMAGVNEFEAWDETYKHGNHNEKDRSVLMVREVAGKNDNITEPEPWTWLRTQGKGRDDVSLRKVGYEIIVASDEPEVVKGDVERGKKIFKTHPIAACTRCHVVNGVGGPVGPALDTIATRKQEDYILQSLVDPGATIAEGFQGKVSPMPPMGVLLKPQELADVMAYLLTLK